TSPRSTSTHSPSCSPSTPNGITPAFLAYLATSSARDLTWRAEVPEAMTSRSAMEVLPRTSISRTSLAFSSSSASMTDLRRVAVVTALFVRAVLKRMGLDAGSQRKMALAQYTFPAAERVRTLLRTPAPVWPADTRASGAPPARRPAGAAPGQRPARTIRTADRHARPLRPPDAAAQ